MGDDMDGVPEGEVRSLRFLRRLVTTLTTVMIVGFIVLIGLLVTRFPSAPTLALPDQITLTDGSKPVAFTRTANWYAVVTADNEILIFGLDGILRQRIGVTVAE